MSALKAPAPIAADAARRTQINVALFSGGSGTHSITQALQLHPQIKLSILINAYDDGLSTGRLRRFFPGMLGPSDVRKNIARLMPVAERSQQALKSLSDLRLPVGIARADALAILSALAQGRHTDLPPKMGTAFRALAVAQSEQLRHFNQLFLDYFHHREAAGHTFDFTDCALGNIFFAGCYLAEQQDFNRTIDGFAQFYEVPTDILIDVTNGDNLFLAAAKEDGSVLLNEADIVAAQSSARISELFLVDQDTYLNAVEGASAAPAEGWPSFLRSHSRTPSLNPLAAAAIARADVIIYGPGTQHSSLFPSYLTQGVGEAIRDNASVDKIFVCNARRDLDIQQDDINDLARKFLHSMNRQTDAGPIAWKDVVTHFFVQRTSDNPDNNAAFIPFDAANFPYPIETVRLRDWESQEGRHSGGYVLDEIRQIVQTRIDIELQSLHHMVTIVIPVLNEERTIGDVLKAINALGLQPLGLTKEILVVDGGSSDQTAAIASSFRNVRVLSVTGKRGRGAALRLGIEAARGNLIAFFPGDNEYNPSDLLAVIESLSSSRYRAVFGTRGVKVIDLSTQLKNIYQGNWGLYVTSKYGGMLLSIMTLFLYNRYVTDILTSVKAFDSDLLRSLRLECSGRDLDTEIVAKLSKRHEFMLEIPVDYSPRTRSQGKKITVGDGIHAILSLLRYRFAS